MIKVIVAIGKNNLIGKDDKMPWHLKSEFAHFRKTTSNHALLFGARTFKGLPAKLPNRFHYVLDYEKVANADQTITNLEDLQKLFDHYRHDPERILFIAGGKSIYENFFQEADELIVSEVKTEAQGNVYLNWDLSNYQKRLVAQHQEFDLYSYTPKKPLKS